MSDPLYREIILEHNKNPANYGVVKGANVDITEANPLCGDQVRMMAKIKNKKITEIGFTSGGCAISKASVSVLTEMVKNKNVEEVMKIKPEELLKELGINFSPARMKCALLGLTTLKKGLGEKNLR
jgi:nitrogen fixation protein NifU and related proteins